MYLLDSGVKIVIDKQIGHNLITSITLKSPFLRENKEYHEFNNIKRIKFKVRQLTLDLHGMLKTKSSSIP